MNRMFTIYRVPFTERFPFSVFHAPAACIGKRFMVNAWKTVNSERLMNSSESI